MITDTDQAEKRMDAKAKLQRLEWTLRDVEAMLRRIKRPIDCDLTRKLRVAVELARDEVFHCEVGV